MAPNRRRLHLDVLRRIVAKAHAAGAIRRTLHSWEWELHADCTKPVRMVLHARKDRPRNWRENPWNPGQETPLTVFMSSRCRKCAACLRRRGRLWYARAEQETFRAARTWFGTLTLSPEAQFQAQLRATARLRKRAGVEWSSLSDGERFAERHSIIGEELTRYLKRVRKEGGTAFRYLLVLEAHKSGLPHYHMLVHEVLGKQPLTKRILEGQWRLGFSKWKLVESPQRVGYVTKYVSKSALARVRASLLYGQGFHQETSSGSPPNFQVESVSPPKRKEMTPLPSPLFWHTLGQTWGDEEED